MKLELNQKTIGSLLIAFSFILLFILIWVKLNVDAEQSFLCQIVEETPEVTMEQCPAHDSNTSWLLLVGFGIAFIILASGFYLLFAPVRDAASVPPAASRKQKIAEPDYSALTEEEKKIYDLLTLKEGSMYQSDLVKETDFTKVKVSRILDRLEGKQMIERKRIGMTNIVVLR